MEDGGVGDGEAGKGVSEAGKGVSERRSVLAAGDCDVPTLVRDGGVLDGRSRSYVTRSSGFTIEKYVADGRSRFNSLMKNCASSWERAVAPDWASFWDTVHVPRRA